MNDIRDYEFVLARVGALGIWNFYPSMEAAELAAPAINAKEAPEQYAPMSYADYKAAERAQLLGDEPTEITADRFHEMLEVLPPMKWEHRGSFQSFLMSEFLTGVYTSQYAQRGHGESATYWTKLVDATDRSTWMK